MANPATCPHCRTDKQRRRLGGNAVEGLAALVTRRRDDILQQQLNTVSRPESCCLSTCDKMKLAAERIDSSEYPEIALALVALDVPVGQVKRLAHAIAAVRGEQCQRHFMGEYADLVWDTVRDQITKEGGMLREQETKVKVPGSQSNPRLV